VFWTHLAPRWARRFTVITWDLKGHGRSEPARTAGGAAIPALARDARQILDAEGVDDAAVVGFSMGCQIALETYRLGPARVRALALLLGPAGRVFDQAFGPVGPILHELIRRLPAPGFRLAFAGLRGLVGVRGNVRLARLLGLIGPAAAREDVLRVVEHLVSAVDPATLAAMALAAQEHSAADLLPAIAVPTLVVAGDRDAFAPAARVGVPLHRAIAGSELLRLPAGTHTSLLEHHREIGLAVERLCERCRAKADVRAGDRARGPG
jgi:pimeloyl-ACP methyl ester carboxylesterase